MKLIIIPLMLLLSNMIYGQDFKYITVTVDPYLSFQYYEHFNRLTLSSPDSPIEFIEGFEFHWGYSYQVKVKQTKLNSRLSDGTEFKYSLKKIISKTKVPDSAQFKMTLVPYVYPYDVDSTEIELNKSFSKINDSTFLYLDEVEIEVPSTLIEDMKSIVEGKMSKICTFIYVAEKRNRIRLIKL